MNQAHLHLLFNHLPILGTLFGLLTLTGGFLLKNNTVKKTALGLFVLSAICAIPAFLTGEGAEEIAENLPGVSENLMEAHEDMAAIFIWMVGALGVLSLITFFTDLKENNVSQILYVLTFVLAAATMVVAQKTGNSGGEIRHTEIRSGTAAAATLELPQGADQAEEEDKDDDE